MDETALASLYERVAPELDDCERDIRHADPTLPEAEVLDRALRFALAKLRYDAARDTFAHLRWRVEQARDAARYARMGSEAARRDSGQVRATSASTIACARRTFIDADGRGWSVREVDMTGLVWARGPHCLVFDTDGLVRRVWTYPADWANLSNDALVVLSAAL
jgi:hypothetical protein